MDCCFLEIALGCELDVCVVCGFRRYDGIKAKGADLLVLFNLAENLLGIKGVLYVYFLPLVLQSQSLCPQVRRAHHPAKHEHHSQHHQLGLSALVLLALVLGDQEENDKHMSMREEHVDPILVTFEGKLLYLNVVFFGNQQILEILTELVSCDDGQPINFSAICWNLRHSCLRFRGGLFGREVELLEG